MELEFSEIRLLEEYRKEGLPWKGWPVLFWAMGALLVVFSMFPYVVSNRASMPTDLRTTFQVIFWLGIYLLWSGGRERRNQTLRKLLLKLGGDGKYQIVATR